MNILILVTALFPYGKGETFIENEIKFLDESFDKVLIYSSKVKRQNICDIRKIPENIKICSAEINDFTKCSYIKSLFKKEVIKEIIHSKGQFLEKTMECCCFNRNVEESKKNINNCIDSLLLTPKDNIIIYSYWLSDIGMTALNIYEIIKSKNPNVHVFARCHGFDLYEERAYLNYLPFQKKMICNFEKIFPCSIQGTEYLKEKYPEYTDKFETTYLGVKDMFKGKFPQILDEFHIVSCSNVIPLKRVNLIVQALMHISDMKVKWTHLGDGELYNEIKQMTLDLPSNISVEFLGRIPNYEIYNFYSEENINLFINVSESEGLPVSIMEAISFGIPVVATDVGGTSEVVINNKNGLLLKDNFEINELVMKIYKVAKMSKNEYSSFCIEARKIYEKNFKADKNYEEFCKKLLTYGENSK